MTKLVDVIRVMNWFRVAWGGMPESGRRGLEESKRGSVRRMGDEMEKESRGVKWESELGKEEYRAK